MFHYGCEPVHSLYGDGLNGDDGDDDDDDDNDAGDHVEGCLCVYVSSFCFSFPAQSKYYHVARWLKYFLIFLMFAAENRQ